MTAENLKSRVSRVVSGGMHALLDQIEDRAPEAMMEQALREAAGVVDDVRLALGQVSANRHLAQQQHRHLNDEHHKLASQLELALAQGRDELAQAAVARQLDIEAQLPILETTLADLAHQETELTGYVAALLAKQREMSAALSEFRKSRAALATSPSAAGPQSTADARMATITGAFNRVHERQTGLSATLGSAQVQQAAQLQALDDLVREQQIAARLAQLKAGRP